MTQKTSELGKLFELVNNKRQRIIKNSLQQFSLTYPQFLVLEAVSQLQKKSVEIKQIDIAEEAGIDVMTVSTIVRNLEKAALIARKNSTKDTRAKLIQLTKEGSEKVRHGRQLLEMIDSRFFSVLDEYTTMFSTLLKRLDTENK